MRFIWIYALLPLGLAGQGGPLAADTLAETDRVRIDCVSNTDCGPNVANRAEVLLRAGQVAAELDAVVAWLADHGINVADHDTYQQGGKAVAVFGDATVCLSSTQPVADGEEVLACAASYEAPGTGVTNNLLQAKFPTPIVLNAPPPGQSGPYDAANTYAHELFHTFQRGKNAANVAFSEAIANAVGLGFDRHMGRGAQWNAPYHQTWLDLPFHRWDPSLSGYGFSYYLHFLAEERRTPDRIDFLANTLALARHSGPAAMYNFAYGKDVDVYTPEIALPNMAAMLNAPYQFPPGHKFAGQGGFAWFSDIPRKVLTVPGDGVSVEARHDILAATLTIQPLHLFAKGQASGATPEKDLYWVEIEADVPTAEAPDLRLVFEHEVIEGNRIVRLMRDVRAEQDIGFLRIVNAPAPGRRILLDNAPTVPVSVRLTHADTTPRGCVTVGQPYPVFDRIPEGGAGHDANWRLETDNGRAEGGVVIPDRVGEMALGLALQAIPTRRDHSVAYEAPAEDYIGLDAVRVVADGCPVRVTLPGQDGEANGMVATYSAAYDTTEMAMPDGTRLFVTKDQIAFWEPDRGFVFLPPDIAGSMSAQMMPVDPDELAVYGDTVEDRMIHLPLVFSEMFSVAGAKAVADGAASSETLTRQRAAPARRTAVPCPDGGTGCEAFQATAFGRVIADVVADDKGRPRSVRLSGGREFSLSYGDFGIMPPPWSVR